MKCPSVLILQKGYGILDTVYVNDILLSRYESKLPVVYLVHELGEG